MDRGRRRDAGAGDDDVADTADERCGQDDR
jgi:hypothetical protein